MVIGDERADQVGLEGFDQSLADVGFVHGGPRVHGIGKRREAQFVPTSGTLVLASSMKSIPLRSPPITEALIDVRVEPRPGASVSDLLAMHQRLGDGYGAPQLRYRVTQQLSLDPEPPPLEPPTRDVDGYVFWSLDRRRVVQVQTTGISVSILRPYKNWDELRAEAHARWLDYVEVMAPQRVVRVAARYINRLDLPLPIAEIKDWLLTYPELGPEVPPVLGEFLMRVVIPLARATGIVTQASAASTDPTRLPVVLDIDVFRAAEFAPRSDTLWSALDELREEKNTLFFGSITEKTGQLYQ